MVLLSFYRLFVVTSLQLSNIFRALSSIMSCSVLNKLIGWKLQLVTAVGVVVTCEGRTHHSGILDCLGRCSRWVPRSWQLVTGLPVHCHPHDPANCSVSSCPTSCTVSVIPTPMPASGRSPAPLIRFSLQYGCGNYYKILIVNFTKLAIRK